jgi:hypothetical protein
VCVAHVRHRRVFVRYPERNEKKPVRRLHLRLRLLTLPLPQITSNGPGSVCVGCRRRRQTVVSQ